MSASIETVSTEYMQRGTPHASFWVKYRVLFALLMILIAGAFFRFYGRNFDQGQNQHPDERFIVGVTQGVTWPSAGQNIFDPNTSPVNLRRDQIGTCSNPTGCRYPYGSLPVYLTRVAGWALGTALPPTISSPRGYYLQDYNAVTLLGRWISSIFDLITILLVFLIGRRLYSSGAGLIAAALVALAVTLIQNAHFYTSDTFLTTFIMGALYFSVVMMQRPAWWAAAGAGACLGLAVATKVSVVFFAVVVVAAVVLRAAYRMRTRKLGADLGDPVGVKPASATERSHSFGGHLLRGLRYLLIAALFAFLAFAITEPYVIWQFDFSRFQVGGISAVLDSNPWWGGIVEQAGIQSGQIDMPYTRQYIGTVPVLYNLQNMVLWGLSPIPGIVVVIGFLLGIWLAFRKRPAEVLLMAGAIPYFATITLPLEAKWMRYMLPLVPIFCLLGAALLVRGTIWMRGRIAQLPAGERTLSTRLRRAIFPSLTAITIAAAFLWSVAFMNIYTQDQSRVQASQWIYANVPGGAVHSVEGWDDEMPLGLPSNSSFNRYGAPLPLNLYDDKPPEGEFEYITNMLNQTRAQLAVTEAGANAISSAGDEQIFQDVPPGSPLYAAINQVGRSGSMKGFACGSTPQEPCLGPNNKPYFRPNAPALDYIILASNRLYGSIPRSPWRYPVQTEFYKLLFEGKLGYKLAQTTQVTPELFGMRFDDQSADESFTVYDHPRVDIFQKVSTLSQDQLRSLFSSSLNRPISQYSPTRQGSALDNNSLAYDGSMPPVMISQLPVVNDYSWNPLAQENTQWIGVLLWLLAMELLGLIVLPVVFTICRNLPDRGYSVTKLVALLLVSWGTWILASTRLVPFTTWSVLLVTVAVALLSLLCWRLGAWRDIRRYLREKRALVIFYEGIFLVGFAIFLWIRMQNPDLWQPYLGGEKPMEFGFLNAILRSPWMPPADPFFSNGVINYYYQGYFIVANLIKLVGVDPAIAFNLTVPLLYGLAFTAAAGVLYNLVAWSQKRRGSLHIVSRSGMAFGLLAGVLMLVIGNMVGLYQLFMITFPQAVPTVLKWVQKLGITEQSLTAPPPTFDFWGPSRVIAHTINEFPFWSFLFADLHPHLMDIPFTLLAVALSLNLAFSGRFKGLRYALRATVTEQYRGKLLDEVAAALSWLWGWGWSGVLRFGVTALSLGTLAAVNSWDFPTYAAVAGGATLIALLLANSVSREQPLGLHAPESPSLASRWTLYITSLVSIAALAGMALLAYLPFFLSFKAFYTKILPLVDGGVIQNSTTIMHRTTLAEFLVIWALFVFIAISYLVYRLWSFPWQAAYASLTRSVPSQPRTLSQQMASGHAFARRLALPGHGLKFAPALSGAEVRSATSQAHFSFRLEPAASAEENAPVSRASAGGNTPIIADVIDGDGNLAGPDIATDRKAKEPNSGVSAYSHGDDSQVDATANYPAYASPQTEIGGNGWGELSGGDEDYGNSYRGDTPSEAANWVAEAHSQAQLEPLLPAPTPNPGVIPLWAGLALLAITTLIVILQLATGQYLIALLAALIGGIAATTLATSRSAASLFTGLLLLGALSVALSVELVYLADHLNGSDSFRMNTVFKFYMQVWVLFALGGATAIYHILYGIGSRRTPRQAAAKADKARSALPLLAEANLLTNGVANGHKDESEPDTAPLPRPSSATDDIHSNWLVWSAEAAAQPVQTTEPDYYPPAPPEPPEPPEPPAPSAADEKAMSYLRTPAAPKPTNPRLRWTAGRITWSGIFALFMLAALVFPLFDTRSRLLTRFPVTPPIGTLSGIKYMTTATYGTDQAPAPINLKYDYAGINWLNQNVKGLRVIAELPTDYYRAGGMRVASNTGLPMVIGSEHEEEQRAPQDGIAIYNTLVGQRRSDMTEFFTTPDTQRALTIINKYNIDYIYLGQLEQAKAKDTGMAKFTQLADAKVGVLKEVFNANAPAGLPGTIIYQVAKDTKSLIGSPLVNTGAPGIGLTPLPTSVPTPVPAPPTNDPALQALIADVTANPTDRNKRMKLVNWYLDHTFYIVAAQQMEIIVKQNPTDVAIRQQLGDAYQAAGQPDKALKAWEDARDVDLNNPAGHNKVGIAYLDRRRTDDAIREFQAAVTVDPTFIESWVHLGNALETKGDQPGAINAYQNAVNNAKGDSSWVQAARDRLSKLK